MARYPCRGAMMTWAPTIHKLDELVSNGSEENAEAVVYTARTPIGKAYRGAFNNTEAPTLAAHAIRNALSRAGAKVPLWKTW